MARAPLSLALLSALSISIVTLAPRAAHATTDLECTAASENEDGSTCYECDHSETSCADQLGSDFHFACSHDDKVDVWCNGPDRTSFGDTSGAACALGAPGSSGSMAAAGLLALAVAGGMARRRR